MVPFKNTKKSLQIVHNTVSAGPEILTLSPHVLCHWDSANGSTFIKVEKKNNKKVRAPHLCHLVAGSVYTAAQQHVCHHPTTPGG